MKRKNEIIIISGPTATGKTSTSINLAKMFGGEIINFDSLLFYKELNIGTAKPTKEEQQGIPHHLISTHSIASPINAADFMAEAIQIINDCHKREQIVFLVGGSGFYLQAVLNGMYQSETTSQEVLNKSERIYKEDGIGSFIDILKDVDPESYQLYHENDHYRIRRAVEHYWMSGNTFSSSRKKMPDQLQDSPVSLFNWNVLHIHLDIPKEEHFTYIVKRTNTMFNDGLLDEVQNLLKNGATGKEKPLNSIGYKEAIGYLNDDYSDLEQCKERICINTRRLAKSQRTWFKKQEKICYNPITDQNEIIETCRSFLK
jgi:tRNA dimethylallyltransferase